MENDQQLDLPAGRPCWLDCRASSEIIVMAGTVWLTRKGDADDHFAAAGARVRPGAGRVLIEGIGPARITIRCAVPPRL